MPDESPFSEISAEISRFRAFLEDSFIRPVAEMRDDTREWVALLNIWEKRCRLGTVDEQKFADFHLDFLAWSAELREQAIILQVKTLDTFQTMIRDEQAAGERLELDPELVKEINAWTTGNSREMLLSQIPIETRRELESDCERGGEKDD